MVFFKDRSLHVMKTPFLILSTIAMAMLICLGNPRAQDDDVPAPEPPVEPAVPVDPDDDADDAPQLGDPEDPAVGAEVPDVPPPVPGSAAEIVGPPQRPPGDVDENAGEPNELVLRDGRVLKDYYIQNWNKTTLTIFHSTGAVNVPAHQLPDNVVKAYGMDPKLSLEEENENRAKRTEDAVADLQSLEERQALRKMPAVTVQGLVVTVSSDGVLIAIDEPEDLADKEFQRIGGRIYDKSGNPAPQFGNRIFGSVWVTDHPLQAAVVDGDLLHFQGKITGRQHIEGKTYPSVRYEKAAP